MKDKSILLTGLRLVGILKMLNKKASTRQEIMDWFNEEFKISPFSMETMKLDINTLLKLGYKIKKHRKNGQNYLSLDEEIIMLKLGEEDISFLVAVKNFALENLDYKDVFQLKEFYKQLSLYAKDEYKQYLLDFKCFNFANKKIIKNLQEVMDNKTICKILYSSPSNNKRQILIQPIRIFVKNNKFYLKCLTNEYSKKVSYRVDNILNVDKAEEKISFIEEKEEKFVYAVKKKSFDNMFLEKDENVINKNSKEVFIETDEENDFFVAQRIISLQKNCTKVKDDKIKNKVIENLKEILELYK